MRSCWHVPCVALLASTLLAGCYENGNGTSSKAPPAKVTKVEAGEKAARNLQAALIAAKPGEVIELGEGVFDCESTISLDGTADITIRGQGADKTRLSFKNQGQGTGGEGLLVQNAKNFTLQDLAVEDARGDAVKIQKCEGVTLRKVRTEWTGGPKETNGGYGLYPVTSSDVLIEECVAIGASDAGIYVGQSKNIIVRRCRAEMNVAGIEIENSVGADVYENTSTNNTGGLLVFSLPDLPAKDGRDCRVFNNQIVANNHPNFAPKGNIVAKVEPGTGIMIMANDRVEVFDNTIAENKSFGVSIVSYYMAQIEIKDPDYDPYCEGISIHGNKFVDNGTEPGALMGKLLHKKLEGNIPDIVYDGIVDPKKQVDGKLPAEMGIYIADNGDADFVNFDGQNLKVDLSGVTWGTLTNDATAYSTKLEPLEAITISGAD